MEKPVIGFIGLGIMGRHMSANLMDSGYQLVVYDHHIENIKRRLPEAR